MAAVLITCIALATFLALDANYRRRLTEIRNRRHNRAFEADAQHLLSTHYHPHSLKREADPPGSLDM